MGRRYINGVDDDVAVATKWWNDYPTRYSLDLSLMSLKSCVVAVIQTLQKPRHVLTT